MIYLNASKGLGDAIYLRAAVLHLLCRAKQITVFTKWGVVFDDLPVVIRPLAERDRQEGLRHVACNLRAPRDSSLTNFEACCIRAGISESVDLRVDWKPRNVGLIDRIKKAAGSRKIFIYQSPKTPRNEDQELLCPNREVFNAFVAAHRAYFRIRLGQPGFIDDDPSAPSELNLFGRASVSDAFDIGTIGDYFFGESCFIPMLGEALDRSFAIMFARRALRSESGVCNMTPERLFHKKHLATAVYDESE